MSAPSNPALILADAERLVLRFTDQIEQQHNNILLNHPLIKYFSLLDKLPAVGGYYSISSEIVETCKDIVSKQGLAGLALYHQLVLAALIVRSHSKIKSMPFTEDVINLFYQDFARIIKYIDSHPVEFYQYSNDKFSKDLFACILRLIPVGAQKIILNGIPRKELLNAGGLTCIKAFSYLMSEVGGLRPIYEMHTDQSDLSLLREFTPEGWDRCYLRMASMLELNQHVKGIYGISWFFDPQIEHISPRLSFLRERPLHNGAKFFFIAKDKKGVGGALTRSTERQKLFEAGKYVPTNYLMVWPRKHLINWANKMRNDRQSIQR